MKWTAYLVILTTNFLQKNYEASVPFETNKRLHHNNTPII